MLILLPCATEMHLDDDNDYWYRRQGDEISHLSLVYVCICFKIF